MAFGTPVARGSASEKVSGASIAFSPSAAIAVGRLALVVFATDNSTTTSGASTHHTSVTDTDGHTWVKLYERTRSEGAVADGITKSAWITLVTTEIGTGDTITGNRSGNTAAKAICILEIPIGASDYAVETPAHVDGTGGATHEVTLSGLSSIERMWIGIDATENEITFTTDADYTEQFDFGTTGTPAANNVTVHVATRLATITGDTFTDTPSSAPAGAGWVVSLIAIREVAGGTLFDETGREISVTGTVTGTDQQDHEEAGREVAAVATVAGTDRVDMVEAAELSIAATVTGTDAKRYVENLTITITSSVTGSDRVDMVEAAEVAVAGTVSGSDRQDHEESSREVTIVSTVTGTDTLAGSAHYDETGREVSGSVTITATDRLDAVENREIEAAATVAASDRLDSVENLTITGVVTIDGSHSWSGAEALGIVVIVTVAATDRFDAVDQLQILITATVTATDALPAASFWSPDPVGFTRNPVGFTRVGPGDSPPW